MTFERIFLGKSGEDAAVVFLERRGYRILERNFRTRFGEIDIIARHQKAICFIEVKTRASQEQGSPLEAVTPYKQRKLSRMAIFYLKSKNSLGVPARFDIVSVEDSSTGLPEIEVLQNAFDLVGDYNY